MFKNIEKKIILGGAQLGFDYIQDESEAQQIEKKSYEIMAAATRFGIKKVDTAKSYGESESNIFSYCQKEETNLTVDTKLSININPNSTASYLEKMLQNELEYIDDIPKNCSVDILYIHDFKQFASNDFLIARILKNYENSHFKRLGVSVYTPAEAKIALNSNIVDTIQIPFNILEDRWDEIFKTFPNSSFIARSIFLQGLLLNKLSPRWKEIKEENKENIFKWLENILEKLKIDNLYELLISYVMTKHDFYGLIIGFNSKNEVVNIMSDLKIKKLEKDEMFFIDSTRPKISNTTLDPRKWNE